MSSVCPRVRLCVPFVSRLPPGVFLPVGIRRGAPRRGGWGGRTSNEKRSTTSMPPAVPPAVAQFEPIVQAGMREGLNRVDAEARAREILFGDQENEERAFLNALDEALWQSCTRLSDEEAWTHLLQCDGLDSVITRLSGMLDSEAISDAQFQTLLSRSSEQLAWSPRKTTTLGAGNGSSAAVDTGAGVFGASTPPAAPPSRSCEEKRREHAATLLQCAARCKLARRSVREAVVAAREQERERQLRKSQAARADAERVLAELRQAEAARSIQRRMRGALSRALAASMRVEEAKRHGAAARVQASARAVRAKRQLQVCRAAVTRLQAAARRTNGLVAMAARRRSVEQAAAEAEAKTRAEAEAKTRAEAEAKTRAEAEAKTRAEAEAKTRAEAEEAKAKVEAEAEAVIRAALESKAAAEAKAQAKAIAEAEAAVASKRAAAAKAEAAKAAAAKAEEDRWKQAEDSRRRAVNVNEADATQAAAAADATRSLQPPPPHPPPPPALQRPSRPPSRDPPALVPSTLHVLTPGLEPIAMAAGSCSSGAASAEEVSSAPAAALPVSVREQMRLESTRVAALSMATVRSRALAELNNASLASAAAAGAHPPKPLSMQPQPPQAAPHPSRAFAAPVAAPRPSTAARLSMVLGRLGGGKARLPGVVMGAMMGADTAPRGLSAPTGILCAVGGLDELQLGMQKRRIDAAATAKALGPMGGGGAAAASNKGKRGISLQWHGTKSFLQEHKGLR